MAIEKVALNTASHQEQRAQWNQISCDCWQTTPNKDVRLADYKIDGGEMASEGRFVPLSPSRSLPPSGDVWLVPLDPGSSVRAYGIHNGSGFSLDLSPKE